MRPLIGLIGFHLQQMDVSEHLLRQESDPVCGEDGVTAQGVAFPKTPTADANQGTKALKKGILNVFVSMCCCFHSGAFQ